MVTVRTVSMLMQPISAGRAMKIALRALDRSPVTASRVPRTSPFSLAAPASSAVALAALWTARRPVSLARQGAWSATAPPQAIAQAALSMPPSSTKVHAYSRAHLIPIPFTLLLLVLKHINFHQLMYIFSYPFFAYLPYTPLHFRGSPLPLHSFMDLLEVPLSNLHVLVFFA